MSNKHAYIFGNGGHSRVIASELKQDLTFIVPTALSQNEISEQCFFKSIDEKKKHDIYIAIGQNDIRCKIFNKLKKLDVKISTFVSSNAYINPDAFIAEGAVLCSGSVIGANAKIGTNTIVNTLSSVDHDCFLGNHSQITAGVTIGGSVTIGENCFFGTKAAVLPNLTIGNNVNIMAGSIVTKSFEAGVLIGGNPAKIIKSL